MKSIQIEVSAEALEQSSLDSLWSLCPLCGQAGENQYCESCDFKWEKGKLYFSGSTRLDDWGEDPN